MAYKSEPLFLPGRGGAALHLVILGPGLQQQQQQLLGHVLAPALAEVQESKPKGTGSGPLPHHGQSTSHG